MHIYNDNTQYIAFIITLCFAEVGVSLSGERDESQISSLDILLICIVINSTLAGWLKYNLYQDSSGNYWWKISYLMSRIWKHRCVWCGAKQQQTWTPQISWSKASSCNLWICECSAEGERKMHCCFMVQNIQSKNLDPRVSLITSCLVLI